jgi:SAM-dependent methyltransferase
MRTRLIDEIIVWDIANWSRFLPFCEPFLDPNPIGKQALEVGGRGGGLSLYLALKGYGVVCSNLEVPEVEARALHARHGVADKITYRAVDILAPPYPEASFDLIVFKSVLHALGQERFQAQAIQELYRLLRPGGLLLFAENLRASPMHRVLRRLFRPAWLLRRRRYPTAAENRLWCRNFREFQGETWGFLGTMVRQERLRRHLARLEVGIMPCVPREWRYIMFACARK